VKRPDRSIISTIGKPSSTLGDELSIVANATLHLTQTSFLNVSSHCIGTMSEAGGLVEKRKRLCNSTMAALSELEKALRVCPLSRPIVAQNTTEGELSAFFYSICLVKLIKGRKVI